jgi:hypothetical protein
MRKLGGFGDIMEEVVEMIHQIAGRFEARSSRIKSHEKRALSHAKMEALHITRRCRCISSNHRYNQRGICQSIKK